MRTIQRRPSILPSRCKCKCRRGISPRVAGYHLRHAHHFQTDNTLLDLTFTVRTSHASAAMACLARCHLRDATHAYCATVILYHSPHANLTSPENISPNIFISPRFRNCFQRPLSNRRTKPRRARVHTAPLARALAPFAENVGWRIADSHDAMLVFRRISPPPPPAHPPVTCSGTLVKLCSDALCAVVRMHA